MMVATVNGAATCVGAFPNQWGRNALDTTMDKHRDDRTELESLPRTAHRLLISACELQTISNHAHMGDVVTCHIGCLQRSALGHCPDEAETRTAH
jgi:hypothetical protein